MSENGSAASGTTLADAVKYTVRMNMAPISLWNNLQWVPTPTVPLFEQLCRNSVTLGETLERIRPCQLEMERAQMTSQTTFSCFAFCFYFLFFNVFSYFFSFVLFYFVFV